MKRTCAFFIMLLTMACFLNAGTFRVMVCPYNEEVQSIIDILFPQKEFDESIAMMQAERSLVPVMKEEGEKLSMAWKSGDADLIAAAENDFNKDHELPEPDGKAFQVVTCTERGITDAQMLSSDPVLMKYLCDSTGSDMIVIPSVTSLQGFRHLRLYVYEYGKESAQLVFERVSQDSDKFGISGALALAPFFNPAVPAVLQLDGIIPGTHIELDGKEVRALEDRVMTTEGMHTVRLSASGYQERYFSTVLAPSAVSSVDASMRAIVLHDLKLDSDPVSDIVIEGKKIGQTPMLIDTYRLPFSALLEAPGYAPKEISIMDEGITSVSASLKPLWMADGANLKKAKDAFYSDFARCIIIFGLKVLAKTFNNGHSTFAAAAEAVANGALAVSLADFAGSLIDYYRTSEYVSE